jgi:hypothetical protein
MINDLFLSVLSFLLLSIDLSYLLTNLRSDFLFVLYVFLINYLFIYSLNINYLSRNLENTSAPKKICSI